MEEKKQKNIHDILPVDLIQRILLRIPVKHLGRLKCVSKFWYSLISDPDFAESHLQLSLAPTHACIYKKASTEAYLFHLEEAFNGDNYEVKVVSFPFKKKPPSEFRVMGSCRGFVLLSRQPHFFVVWNPLTGFSKRVSYSWLDIVHRNKGMYFHFPGNARLYGFGYDTSRDDYLVVIAWHDGDCQHLDCLSLRTNSWINLDAALPKPLGFMEWVSHGLFLNGSIHWFPFSYSRGSHCYREGLLTFDLKERSFSNISLPEQLIMGGPATFVILGGCLALYSQCYVERKTDIWVMKEYKVQSSWTLYEVPYLISKYLCLSNHSDIFALEPISVSSSLKFAKYNIREELLQHFTCPPHLRHYTFNHASYTVYTESLLLFPSNSKHKDKKKNVI
ncbi:F-box protein CPR1-like [Arachis stenosperma]|uniref:F-box protein CPR1-like n=1 Tax=Arachis stenosperma TaxID=217475 RepID=UPI0025ABD4D4|nr:F-box protein CPR1-like [Arachis stenosperma]